MKSRSEIKATSRKIDTWVSPHHNDGGWHNTPGCERFTHEWNPLKDHILVEFMPEQRDGLIIAPEIAIVDNHSRFAKVLKVGAGEREMVTGEMRGVNFVKPGDVVILGQYSDWESQDGKYGIFQEEDVRCIVG